ncbi:MAG: hypothetical protein Q9195_003228 [Heterodermia aff. obscurata]
MPPHGRRRFSPLTAIVALFFLFSYTASAASAVLGIDIGTEYIKAALVKPGIPLEIVLTKDSKRKESAAVAFKSSRSKKDTTSFPERIYGGDALAIAPRFPGDVYPNLKPLLGLQYKGSDVVASYQERYPGLRPVEWEERGTVGFQSPSFDDGDEPFLVEELLAMELKNIRGNAVALAGKGSSIRDAVITIPAFYTAEEKRAVALAAELAGLRLLAMISDGLSVGLNYATSRTFPTINDGGKPEIHLVYDMGAGSATATVLKFQGRTVKDVGKYNKTIQEVQVLGAGWDRSLGGDALNGIIVDDMITKFMAIPKVKTLEADAQQVRGHGRTMAKLWKEAERLRQVLSANTETSSSFEGLFHEDVNFKYKLTRAEFEKLTLGHAKRVETPLKQALASAKVSLADIESVILHGGAVRTPFVQRQLEEVVGSADKLRTNVNSDEAAVFGAAFKAAGISPSFRVKDIRTSDSAAYAVFFKWTNEDKIRQQKLFVPTSHIGAEKQVPLKVTEDFTFSLFEQASSATGDLIDRPVLNVQTKNMTASVAQLVEKFGCIKGDINTSFAIRLSPIDGLPEVVKGSVSCETTAQKSGVVDGVKDFFGFGSKKGDQEPLKADKDSDSVKSSSSEETVATSSPKESKTSGTSTAEDAKATEKSKETKKRIETIHIDFSTEAVGLSPPSPEHLQRITDRLGAFDSSDRSRLKREETLNTLEAFTYKARDLLDDEGFIAASTDKERNQIEDQFKSASEWLYGDGADATREALKERLDGLHGLVDPVQRRKQEAGSRPAAVKALQEALNQTKAMVSVVRQQREAQSVAEEASSSAAAADAESASQTTTAPSSTDDGFGDLDDEPVASSTTTTAAPSPPSMLMYSEEDLKEVTDSQDSVQAWLDEKLAEQGKLGPTDDPVMLSTELTAKSKDLNDMVMKLLTKSMKVPPKSKPKPKVKSAKTKSGKKGKPSISPDILNEMPDASKITDEQISEAIAQQKSKATESKVKAEATGKEDKQENIPHGEL